MKDRLTVAEVELIYEEMELHEVPPPYFVLSEEGEEIYLVRGEACEG